MEGLIRARDRARIGESPSTLARAVQRKELSRIRRGVYVASDHWQAADATQRHLLSMRALVAASTTEPLFSHESAAVVWGIPLVGAVGPRPHMTLAADSTTRRRADVRLHHREVFDIDRYGGFQVTSFRQTVLDLVTTSRLERAVPALDFALSAAAPCVLLRSDLAGWLRRERPFRGARRLEVALGIATGACESALESLSLLRFAEHGIRRPVQQHEIETELGVYRVDFYWPHARIAGEADGRLKYQTQDDLWREKRREDAVRERVDGLVRWSWDDAWRGTPLVHRLRRAGV